MNKFLTLSDRVALLAKFIIPNTTSYTSGWRKHDVIFEAGPANGGAPADAENGSHQEELKGESGDEDRWRDRIQWRGHPDLRGQHSPTRLYWKIKAT